jgi:hypothetical protein
MKNGWREFLAREEAPLAPARATGETKAAPPSETAALIRQGTLRALLLLSEHPVTRDEARQCAQQIAQLRRSLIQAEAAFRRRAGEPV